MTETEVKIAVVETYYDVAVNQMDAATKARQVQLMRAWYDEAARLSDELHDLLELRGKVIPEK